MAKPAAAASAGMERGDLKRMLRFALEEPIQVAFALGRDGKAIVQLDKRKQGRTLEKVLRDDAPDSKNHRWGTAVVDPDHPKLIKFVVNKPCGGMARKLTVALKGTGFSKVQIVLEDGSAVEAHEEEDDTASDGTSSGQVAASDGEDTARPTVGGRDHNDLEEPPSFPPSPMVPDGNHPAAQGDAGSNTEQSFSQPDPKELARSLTGLVKQMLEVIRQDPSQKAALVEFATDAQASLKRGDLDQAAAGIEVFHRALGAATDVRRTAGDLADRDQGAASANRAGDGAADLSDPDVSSDLPAAWDDSAASGTDGGGRPQWEAGPSFDPRDDTSGKAASRPVQDAGALTAALTGLVKQIVPLIASDPVRRDALKDILAQAQASLKRGDLDTVGGHVDTLQAMLDGAGPPANGQGGQPNSGPQGAADANGAASPVPAQAAASAIAKARQVWIATRQKVECDLSKMHGVFTSALEGYSLQDDLAKTLRSRVDAVLDTLDEALAHTLDGVNGAADPAQRAKLVEDAHALIGRYQAHVATDETIALLDSNPFTPLAIQKTMTATLAALSKAIR